MTDPKFEITVYKVTSEGLFEHLGTFPTWREANAVREFRTKGVNFKTATYVNGRFVSSP